MNQHNHNMNKTVSDLTWPWRDLPENGTRGAPKPHPAPILLPALIGYAVAAALFIYLQRGTAAILVASINTLILLLAVAAPSLHGRFHGFFLKLGRGTGQALAWLLLTPFFYLVMGAGRLILILRGIDPMHRGFQPRRESYWLDRTPRHNRHFSRQY